MRKKLRFYKQHSMETCGPACMLMLLDLYGKIEYPTQKQEMKLYSLYRSKAFNGVNGAAIANCLSKNGLNVHLAHSSAEMMENRSGYFTDEQYTALLAEYRADTIIMMFKGFYSEEDVDQECTDLEIILRMEDLILKMMQAALSNGENWLQRNTEVEEMLESETVGISDDFFKQQIKDTSSVFAMDMLLLKFIQGLPIVGVIGSAANPVYYSKVMKYVQLKYRKRYLWQKRHDPGEHYNVQKG